MYYIGIVPVQLDSLARFDSRQIGPGLIRRGSNWVKESQYGLDHKITEQVTRFMTQRVNESELHFTL